MNVYKFDYFTNYRVVSFILDSTRSARIDYPFTMDYGQYLTIPIPNSVEVQDIRENTGEGFVDIKSLLDKNIPTLTSDSKLFICSACTIPRAKVAQKYTRTIKSSKADIYVVPTPKNIYKTECVALFVNKAKYKIYTVAYNTLYTNGKTEYLTPEFCKRFPLGTKVIDINPSLKYYNFTERNFYYHNGENPYRKENWADFLDSTLVYCGNALEVDNKDSWVADYLYNTIQNVIAEDRVLATLGSEDNKITEEVYDNIAEMLESPDPTIVGLGLKTLAELDYKKYYNTVIYLLVNTSKRWNRNPMKNNISVKYMLDFLGIRRYVLERYLKNTTKEDFDLLKRTLKNSLKEELDNSAKRFKERFPFVDINVESSFTINPILNDSTDFPVESKDGCVINED